MRRYRQSTPVRRNRPRKQKRPVPWRYLGRRVLQALAVVAGSAALLLGAGQAARMLRDSELFMVAAVQVENHQRLSREEVVALSDIAPGTRIFDLDLNLIGSKISENPWVAAARVQRVFPNEVRIRIEERTPQAIVRLGYLYYVDNNGEIFKMLDARDRLDYPLISGIDRQLMLDHPEQGRELLLGALGLLQKLAERRIFGLDQVSELGVDAHQGITLYTYRGGVPIRFGQNGYRTKLDRLERVYQELQPRLAAIDYVDLNVVERVIVKFGSRPVRGRS